MSRPVISLQDGLAELFEEYCKGYNQPINCIAAGQGSAEYAFTNREAMQATLSGFSKHVLALIAESPVLGERHETA